MPVSLLLPMNGDNNSTVFTDCSPSPKTITRYGDAKISTAQSKFYGSSGYFDGSGDYLYIAPHPDFDLSGDFTIEAWVKLTAVRVGNSSEIFGINNGNELSGRLVDFKWNGWGGAFTVDMRAGGVTKALESTRNPGADTNWHHVCVCVSSENLFIGVDGIVTGPVAVPGARTMGLPVYIGRAPWYTPGDAYHYLQDLRVTKGVARYTEDFTPPNSLLSPVSGTIRDVNNNPCQRKVYAVSRPTDATAPQILAHGLSDPITGAYDLLVPSGEETTVIALGDEGENALIYDRVIPQ